jgi:hypothetical protein
MDWDGRGATVGRPPPEVGGTALGTRDLIPAWSVVRQLRSKDRFALGESARSGCQANLEPRTARADEVRPIYPYCALECGQRVYVQDGEATQKGADCRSRGPGTARRRRSGPAPARPGIPATGSGRSIPAGSTRRPRPSPPGPRCADQEHAPGPAEDVFDEALANALPGARGVPQSGHLTRPHEDRAGV